MPAVSVIVPARDAEATLTHTLDSLAAQQLDEAYEVIVVDDRSADGTAEVVRAAGGPVRLVTGTGEGAAAARNLGAHEASADVLAFTDSDCAPRGDWLAAGLRRMRHGAELLQGAVHSGPDAGHGPFSRRFAVSGDHGLYESANLFVTRERFDAVGGFEPIVDHRGGRPMGEDAWFGWRVRRTGAAYEFASEVVVEHAVLHGTATDFVLERVRVRHFPEMTARIPELRTRFLYGRVFLSRRSAAFDLALCALLVARRRRSPLPLAGVVPYAATLYREARRWRSEAPMVAAVHAMADLVTFVSLLRGTATSRTPVL